MSDWVKFYRPFFPDEAKARAFVEACERLTPPSNVAKILMHQAQRLISISDDIQDIRPHNEPLRLVFLIICSEHVAKLFHNFTVEGKSREYVGKFFEEFLCDRDKNLLCRSFVRIENAPERSLPFQEVVDLLYAVRCDVVHEGKTWGFTFHDGVTSMINVKPDIEVRITFQDLRSIVVRGCLNAITRKL